jgi:hypothetical protein
MRRDLGRYFEQSKTAGVLLLPHCVSNQAALSGHSQGTTFEHQLDNEYETEKVVDMCEILEFDLKEDPNLDKAQNNKLNREKSQKQSKYQSKWQSEECRKARRCHASHAEMQLLGHFFRRHYLRYQRATLVGSDEMDYIQSFEDW